MKVTLEQHDAKEWFVQEIEEKIKNLNKDITASHTKLGATVRLSPCTLARKKLLPYAPSTAAKCTQRDKLLRVHDQVSLHTKADSPLLVDSKSKENHDKKNNARNNTHPSSVPKNSFRPSGLSSGAKGKDKSASRSATVKTNRTRSEGGKSSGPNKFGTAKSKRNTTETKKAHIVKKVKMSKTMVARQTVEFFSYYPSRLQRRSCSCARGVHDLHTSWR